MFIWQGCATVQEVGEDDGEIVDGNIKPERLIKKMEANRRKIRAFEGKGELMVQTPEIDNSAFFQAILKRPDSLNVNVYGPFGIELANILLTEKEFKFYESLNNTMYRGNVDDVALRNIFKVDLSFDDVRDAFAGSVNLTKRLYTQPQEFKFEKGYFYIAYSDSVSGNLVSYKIKSEGLSIETYTVKSKKGEVLIEGKYSNFKMVEGVMLPQNIEVKSPKLKQSLKISYESMEVNKDPQIDFNIPSDATVIEY
jgi:hypothetical protein